MKMRSKYLVRFYDYGGLLIDEVTALELDENGYPPSWDGPRGSVARMEVSLIEVE